MRFSELETWPHDQLTLSVKIHIFRIEDTDISKTAVYNYLPASYPWTHRTAQACTWKIEGSLLKEMKAIKYNTESFKAFMSPIFCQMWCIVILPKGIYDQQEAKCHISLQLCALPYDVDKFDANRLDINS